MPTFVVVALFIVQGYITVTVPNEGFISVAAIVMSEHAIAVTQDELKDVDDVVPKHDGT